MEGASQFSSAPALADHTQCAGAQTWQVRRTPAAGPKHLRGAFLVGHGISCCSVAGVLKINLERQFSAVSSTQGGSLCILRVQ
jgi:hypothetical protein